MNTKQKTEEKVFSFIEEHHMLKAQDKVVVGISGGADSVCLLFVLLEYQKYIPFSLAVVHVNHGIRQEAKEDENYVKELCRAKEIPFYPFYADVRQVAKDKKCSEEEAGRNARYEAFAKAAKDFGANKIAVAHNSNDRAETMLFHLFRGSGMKGLASIRPVRENIIRPILCLERKEVEAYLREQEIVFCRDATNEKDDYTRNRIRHHIMPFAEQEIVTGCVNHMAQTADMLAETEEYLEQQTLAAIKECVQQYETKKIIRIEGFLRQHKVIGQRVLYVMVCSLTPFGKDISYVHIKNLQTLFTQEGNRCISLPFGIIGRREYDKVILQREENPTMESTVRTHNLKIPMKEKVCRFWLNEREVLEFRVLSGEEISPDFPTNEYTKWFDYDKIEQSLDLRNRQMGDYLTIADKNGELIHKSLKSYMVNEKIPRTNRDDIPLIAEGNHVLWLIGHRISEYYKINENTKRILQVQLKGRD